jgi:hypothetical protein
MRKLLQFVVAGLVAVSFSTFAADGDKGGAKAGPTDNPNVTRDAQGREHVNKGKHAGQAKKDGAPAAGSTSDKAETPAPSAAPAPSPAPVDAPKKAD